MKKEKSAQNSRSTFAVLFYLNTSKVKKSGKCPVMGRITVDGKSTAFSTGLELHPEVWNGKECTATGNTAEAKEVNKRIAQYRNDLIRHYGTLLENKSYITAEPEKLPARSHAQTKHADAGNGCTRGGKTAGGGHTHHRIQP